MNSIQLKRERENYGSLIEPTAKRCKLDYELVLKLPTDLWENILAQALALNGNEDMPRGQLLSRFSFVCKQWYNCHSRLQIRLINSAEYITNIFATYAHKKLRKNPLATRLDLFFKEVHNFFLQHGACVQALNLSHSLPVWKPSLISQMVEASPAFKETEIPFLLSCCKDLISLNLEFLKVKDIDFSCLPVYPNLQTLNLMGSALNDKNIVFLTNYLKLQSLDISNSSVTDNSFVMLAALTNLCYLNLTECTKITAVKSNYDHLSSLNKLTSLRMSLLEDSINEDCFEFVMNFTSLHSLDISNCFINPRVAVSYLCSLTSLSSLIVGTQDDLEDTDCIQALASLTQLMNLEASSSAINTGDLHLLSQLSQLKRLDVYVIPLTDANLIAISKFTSLNHLELFGVLDEPENNLFTSAGLNQLTTLPNLQTINIIGESYTKPFTNIPEPASYKLIDDN